MGRRLLARRAPLAVGCLALVVASLLLTAAPTFDPWAWIVFGKELVHPEIGFSTLSATGWKPLPVLLTAPFALLGGAAPVLWLATVRAAGLAAMVLAFHLANRSAGRVAGAVAAFALLASSDWLRYMLAGNIEPVVAALLLGAIALHLSKRRAIAFVLGALAGAARPEVWLLVGCYAAYLWWSERLRWPLTLAVPCMLALWIVPDWAGSGSPFHTFHSATVSHEPHALQLTDQPALELVKGGAGILPVPIWLAASAAVVLGWQTRDRTTLALAVVAGAWAIPAIAATALGYPAVPRYLAGPAAVCCPLAGAGIVAVARLPSHTRTRIILVAVLLALSAPFAIARVAGVGRQASAAERGGEDLASLLQAVDRARALAPVGRLHPAIEPMASANALVWRLGLKLNGVARTLTPPVQVAFLKGGERAAVARLHARGATSRRLTGAGPWSVLRIYWPPKRRVLGSSQKYALAPRRPTASARALLGHSEGGRAIVAVRVGNPRGTRVLVIGCIHGNECAGISITRNLARAPTGADVWIVPDLNPDGHARGTRQDGRGVDLNANWSAQWHGGGRPWDTYYAGPRPFSERETQIARRLILRLRPRVTIWFHQHMDLVWAWGPSSVAGRSYAQAAGMRFYHHPWLPGTASNWQNDHLPGASAFTVELPAGSPSPGYVRRQVRAILATARAPGLPATGLSRPGRRRERGGQTASPLRMRENSPSSRCVKTSPPPCSRA